MLHFLDFLNDKFDSLRIIKIITDIIRFHPLFIDNRECVRIIEHNADIIFSVYRDVNCHFREHLAFVMVSDFIKFQAFQDVPTKIGIENASDFLPSFRFSFSKLFVVVLMKATLRNDLSKLFL